MKTNAIGTGAIAILMALASIAPAFAQTTNIASATADFDSSVVTDSQIQSVETEFSATTKPGDFGYPFKRFGEWLGEMFTFDRVAKAKLKVEFARERLAEARELAEQEKDKEVEGLVEEAQRQSEDAKQLISSEAETQVSENKGIGEKVREIAATADAVFQKSILVLQLVREKVPENAQAKIDAVIEKIIEHRAEIRARIQERVQNATEQQIEAAKEKIRERIQNRLNERVDSLEEKLVSKAEEKITELQNELESAQAEGDTQKVAEISAKIDIVNIHIESIQERADKARSRIESRAESGSETETEIENESETEKSGEEQVPGTTGADDVVPIGGPDSGAQRFPQ